MARKKKPVKTELEVACENLSCIRSLNETGRIELLLDTLETLDNGDALAYFERWLDVVCSALGIDVEESIDANPYT